MESRDWSSDVCSSDLFPSHDTTAPTEGLNSTNSFMNSSATMTPSSPLEQTPVTNPMPNNPFPSTDNTAAPNPFLTTQPIPAVSTPDMNSPFLNNTPSGNTINTPPTETTSSVNVNASMSTPPPSTIESPLSTPPATPTGNDMLNTSSNIPDPTLNLNNAANNFPSTPPSSTAMDYSATQQTTPTEPLPNTTPTTN